MAADDRYTIPGSGGVLRNKLGLTTQEQLAREDYLLGLDTDEFTTRLADRWGYLTTTHPFRDGNTRTQSAYVDRLAVRAGHPIDWRLVDVDTLRRLRLQAVSGSERPLAEFLRERLLPASADPTATGLAFPGTRSAPRRTRGHGRSVPGLG